MENTQTLLHSHSLTAWWRGLIELSWKNSPFSFRKIIKTGIRNSLYPAGIAQCTTRWDVHETTVIQSRTRLHCDLLFGRSPGKYVRDLQARLKDVHNFGRSGPVWQQRRWRRHESNWTHVQRRIQGMVWNPVNRKGLSPKLQSNWDNSYTFIKRLNDVVVRLRKYSKSKVVNFDKLVHYYCLNQSNRPWNYLNSLCI